MQGAKVYIDPWKPADNVTISEIYLSQYITLWQENEDDKKESTTFTKAHSELIYSEFRKVDA